jgi:hypothetical protein
VGELAVGVCARGVISADVGGGGRRRGVVHCFGVKEGHGGGVVMRCNRDTSDGDGYF